MSRPRNALPSYCHHKPTGTARCWVGGRWVSLGKYNSPESREAYARLIAERAAAPHADAVTASAAGKPDPTVNEVLLAFLTHATQHYRTPDGAQTSAVDGYKAVAKLVRTLYGSTPAREFGPLALKAVRQQMLAAGWGRTTINGRVGKLKHVFKWATAEELVPAGVYQALAAVGGLQKGRTSAPEPEPVGPVADEDVRATLPHLNRHVRGMVEVQLLTGMRPQDVCRLRPCDVDTSGPVWAFRPALHKNAHRGKARVVMIGPKAQAALAPFTPGDPTAYYFSPAQVLAELRAARAAARKTPRYPSHVRHNAARRKAAPARVPADRYRTQAYRVAVARACRKAGVPEWSPNQLRHTHGTTVRRLYGLEAAQVSLGHERANTTEIYAEKNLALAAKVAAEIG